MLSSPAKVDRFVPCAPCRIIVRKPAPRTVSPLGTHQAPPEYAPPCYKERKAVHGLAVLRYRCGLAGQGLLPPHSIQDSMVQLLVPFWSECAVLRHTDRKSV